MTTQPSRNKRDDLKVTSQTEALRLADDLDQCHAGHVYEGPTIFSEAAAELRRLHEVNQELLKVLRAILLCGTDWQSIRDLANAYIDKHGEQA